jgi:hypothetical protein
LQTTPHVLFAHVALPSVTLGHALSHAPQCSTVLVRLTHEPPQLLRPPAHDDAQAPWLQTCSALQLVPHAPQFALSVLRFVQMAFAPVPHAVVAPSQTFVPAPSAPGLGGSSLALHAANAAEIVTTATTRRHSSLIMRHRKDTRTLPVRAE